MNKVEQVFQKNRSDRKGCLIGYIMAGDPAPDVTPKIADALVKGGVDILELGLPFSDPIADGSTIQDASQRALKAGTSPLKVLQIAKEIKAKNDVPVVIMTYYNPVFRFGLHRFLGAARAYGVDGFIVPDLPVEEADAYREAAKTKRLDTIFLAAPSTSNERLKKIVAASSGFLYLVSRFGVTGASSSLADSTIELIRRVQPFTLGRIPLAVGFGISKPEHVKRVISAGADAAIVGSAFINLIVKNQGDISVMLKELQRAASDLKAATKI